MKKDIYQVSNEIKAEADYLDELMCDEGYDCDSIRTELERTLSMIKWCQYFIKMKNESLKNAGK